MYVGIEGVTISFHSRVENNLEEGCKHFLGKTGEDRLPRLELDLRFKVLTMLKSGV